MRNKIKKTQRKTGMNVMKIDIESIYHQMQSVITERERLQEEHDNLWIVIKRYHCDRSSQMNKITKKIGNCTYKLNKLISELCQFKKTHKAMNLAHSYLGREITRNLRIIESTKRLVSGVNAGRSCLISSSGVTDTDTYSLENYIKHKKEQVQRLEKWKRAVEKYMV